MWVTDDQKQDELLALLREIRGIVGVPPKVWLTPEKAAVYLGLSRTRIYQYIRADRIPFHRLPDSNQVRLNANELDEWVQNGGEAVNSIADETLRRILK